MNEMEEIEIQTTPARVLYMDEMDKEITKKCKLQCAFLPKCLRAINEALGDYVYESEAPEKISEEELRGYGKAVIYSRCKHDIEHIDGDCHDLTVWRIY